MSVLSVVTSGDSPLRRTCLPASLVCPYPSTVGTLLREFFGHARQLDSVLTGHLAGLQVAEQIGVRGILVSENHCSIRENVDFEGNSAYSIPAYCAEPDIDVMSWTLPAGPVGDFIEH